MRLLDSGVSSLCNYQMRKWRKMEGGGGGGGGGGG